MPKKYKTRVSYENYGILEPFFEDNRMHEVLKMSCHDMFGRHGLVQYGGGQGWAFEVMIWKSVRKSSILEEERVK